MSNPFLRNELLRKNIRREVETFPKLATIHRIDGDRVDIRIPPSASVLHHIEVLGDVDSLAVGQSVYIDWAKRDGSHGPVPRVLAGGSGAVTVSGGGGGLSIPADEVTITDGNGVLAVKLGGISLSHLNFTPALSGHSHAQAEITDLVHDAVSLQGKAAPIPEAADDQKALLYDLASDSYILGTVASSGGGEVSLSFDSYQHAYGEVLTGQIDGTATSFATMNAFDAESLRVYVNGVRQEPSAYTVDAGSQSFTLSFTPAVGDTLWVDYIYLASNPATGYTHVYDEDLSAQIDGTQTVFAIANICHPASLRVYLNGVRQPASTWTLSANNQAFTLSFAPIVGDTLTVDYSIAALDHNHDDLYYSKSEVDTLLAGAGTGEHDHNDLYYTESEIDTFLVGKSDTGHSHDDLYYTESEVNTLLAGKSNTGHNHSGETISPTKIIVGGVEELYRNAAGYLYTNGHFQTEGSLLSKSHIYVTNTLYKYGGGAWRNGMVYVPFANFEDHPDFTGGIARGALSSGTIDMSKLSSLPADTSFIKAYLVTLLARTDGTFGRTDAYFSIGLTTSSLNAAARTLGGNVWIETTSIVKCTSTGDFAWKVGQGTTYPVLRVQGYFV